MLLKNAEIFYQGAFKEADLLIADGKIKLIGSSLNISCPDNEDLTGSWFYMDNSSSDDNERYYYYSVPVAPGDMTSRLINKVTYTGDIPENAHFELKVLAEGVSSKQEDSRADWGL